MRSDAVGQRRRAQDEPALGPDRGATGRGQGHPVAAGPAERGSRPAGAGEDLVRAHGVERLEALEGDDHDVALLHESTVRGSGVGVNDLVPTDSAIVGTTPSLALWRLASVWSSFFGETADRRRAEIHRNLGVYGGGS